MQENIIDGIKIPGKIIQSVNDVLEKERIYIPSEACGFFISLVNILKKRLVVVASCESRVEQLSSELRAFVGRRRVYEFPDFEAYPHERLRVSRGQQAKRLQFLKAVEGNKDFIGVVSPRALVRLFPAFKNYKPVEITLQKGSQKEFERLIDELIKMGYERVEMVSGPGSFAIRGGIIDVFPSVSSEPYRVEFFGDEIESIRLFNPESQLSTRQVDVCVFGWEIDTPLNFKRDNYLEKTGEIYRQFTEYRDNGYSLSGFWPLIFSELKTLTDYLKDVYLIFEDFEEFSRTINRTFTEIRDVVRRGFMPADEIDSYYKKPSIIEDKLLGMPFIEFSGKNIPNQLRLESIKKTALRNPRVFDSYLNKARKMIVFCGFDIKPERIRKTVSRIIKDLKINYETRTGYLEKGFYMPALKLIVLPAAYFVGNRIVMSSHKPTAISERIDLDAERGDLVVHSKYGIGKYKGAVKELRDGALHELVVIDYADGRLKIPVSQINKITKYIGSEKEIKLDRLSSPKWKKAKRKARKSARKLAFNLLKVYAKRSLIKRPSYDLSNPWITEFESTFPYQETPDQTAAINDIYLDMSGKTPMERLIVGDVGYGKTEVAMRAAFVAVASTRKAMVLCPTTVLAEQHYETWKDRFSTFPVAIEMLSRFQKPSRRKEIINRFNLDKVDILIGTHVLLGEDINLENVGLVVIDEEHRFGVNQKEIFKARKPEIDILFMSATPIPRTLQLALSGVKDVSLMETPPPGRLPIVTHVGEYDESLVRSALERELSRSGQAIYVHNRISELDSVAENLSKIIAEARITVVHGRMAEKKLENRMVAFWHGEYDILVTTTIVESGLDMPLVNTLIVDDSERLGLSQAYQLRGRIGRSYRQAYAYFLTAARELSEEAESRLKALVELSGVGAGFKLALKDLEIRGAGNLLGPQQHGHMMRVGMQLFTNMLEDEIKILKGEKKAVRKKEITIDVPLDTYVPDSYAGGLKAKYEIYRKVLKVDSKKKKEKFLSELKDRFGKIPEPVINLINLGLIRNLAVQLGFNSISYKNGYLLIRGKRVSEDLKEEIPLLKDAKISLKQIKIKTRENDLIDFLLGLFTDIISTLSTWKEND